MGRDGEMEKELRRVATKVWQRQVKMGIDIATNPLESLRVTLLKRLGREVAKHRAPKKR